MSTWILLATIGAVLYGLWMLMQFVFEMIDHAHATWRESEGRRGGSERASGEAD